MELFWCFDCDNDITECECHCNRCNDGKRIASAPFIGLIAKKRIKMNMDIGVKILTDNMKDDVIQFKYLKREIKALNYAIWVMENMAKGRLQVNLCDIVKNLKETYGDKISIMYNGKPMILHDEQDCPGMLSLYEDGVIGTVYTDDPEEIDIIVKGE